MKKNNLFWGLMFILAAFLIIFNQAFGSINPIKLFFTIIFVYIIIDNIPKFEFFGICFSLGMLATMYPDLIGLQDISKFSIIMASCFIGIGLSIIFKPMRRHRIYRKYHTYNHSNETTENFDAEEVYAQVRFGSSSKYIRSKNLKKVYVDCSFGGMKVYLDNAELNHNGAEIVLDVNFSGVEIYIPRDWVVRNNVDCVFAGIEINDRFSKTNSDSPILHLKGDIKFGGVEVNYI